MPAFLGFGCSEELGPEQFVTTRVSGRMVEDGHPVLHGWIEFIPVEGTVGNQRSARIQADGSFQTDQVPVGENAIRLVNAPIQLPGGSRLFGSFTTPIRRVIPQVPQAPIEIDLVQEAIRYQASQPRPSVGDRSSQAPGAVR
jgi:hypothetical protein